MLEFRQENNLQEYDEFINGHKGSFIQCSRWPEIKTAWKPYFFSGFENGKRVFACLVLERNLSVCGKIWYIPDGPVTDYTRPDIIKEFTKFIKGELKKHNATALLTDPHIPLRINNVETEQGLAVHKMFIDAGYELNHDAARYIYKAPIQYMIDLKDDNGKMLTAKELLKKCEKGVRYSVRVGESRGLVSRCVNISDVEKDPLLLEDFATVMRSTSERDSFIEKNTAYIKKLMTVFHDCMDLTLVYYDKNADKKFEDDRQIQLAKNLEKIETAKESVKNRLNNENETILQQSKNYKLRTEIANEFSKEDKFVVAGGLTIRYGGVASCMFGGSIDVLRNETRPSHFVNYLRLCQSIDSGCDYHDLGYVLVDNLNIPADKTQPLGELTPKANFVGINSFKASLGADLYQFAGEYVLINNKLRYNIYDKLVPAVKKVKVKLLKALRASKN
ncbi:MAG: peptidoglycan bridge formation glycyltransferase FemA/FemB family protein [Clostridia bacterium]|nr:peptidoglycan bridge formation glycyltransferase FemA/FemB family protein [Clostridia bacterium]